MTSDFRLPAKAVNSTFRTYALALLLGLPISYFTVKEITLSTLSLTVIIAATILAIGYRVTRRHVWVSVSEQGLAGVGKTGRRVMIAWSDPVSITKARESGMQGLSVQNANTVSTLKSSLLKIFIPGSILSSSDFHKAVESCAPVDHPLRNHVRSAA
jgi:hypothetical protein